jgi:enoyl-CoA hydratase/carnithine racemase
MSIDVTVDGHVALVTINRPEARNSLDPEHNVELGAAVEELDANRDIRAIVLTGAGEIAFCAGADLKTLLPPTRDRIRAGETPEWNLGGFSHHAEDRVPLIAAINGHALAGGLEIALACDIRVATPNATFGLAETRWGLSPGSGGTQRLPRAIPMSAAMEMLMTGDPIGVDDALRWGLINRVHTQDRLLPEALDLAGRIAARGPLAVRAARKAVLHGESVGLEDGLKAEFETFLVTMRTQDALEGSTAFVEKRIPQYEGR